MPRLIMLVGVVIAIGVVLRQIIENGGAGRGNTYRPHKRGWGGPAANPDKATFLASRAELAGVRDSFSAEPINPERAILRCPGCQAFYHADSIATLARENHGRCMNCASTQFDPVQITG